MGHFKCILYVYFLGRDGMHALCTSQSEQCTDAWC